MRPPGWRAQGWLPPHPVPVRRPPVSAAAHSCARRSVPAPRSAAGSLWAGRGDAGVTGHGTVWREPPARVGPAAALEPRGGVPAGWAGPAAGPGLCAQEAPGHVQRLLGPVRSGCQALPAEPALPWDVSWSSVLVTQAVPGLACAPCGPVLARRLADATAPADNVPEELRDPFYVDQYEQEHIKPPVTRLLLSGELYCRVCGLILQGEQAAALQGHQSVIQALSRKGIYVMESDGSPVTDPDLGHAPIKMVSAACGVPG
ncbi:Calmodulin-regulated spectrin-associated protein 1 [Galemys pyrenaicus]|uniref:Calmodulin-regulated spectrin-associated protein 1 n=1 Tax=Galemys pyrenaicus TaxID=202257 RepID=A0A8J6DSX8_GALPY|nr:Calmodulin-regulated spectrin-associated protein 1 [Galemys pyrenaicus]